MLDSKAIRPEIKGLFDTIILQAEKYAQAFELLDSHKQDYEKLARDLKTLNETVYSSVNHELISLKQKYDDIIKILKIESSQINQKYSEINDLSTLQQSYFSALESIKIIQTSLEQQFGLLKKGVDEYTDSINEIKHSADEKVNDFLKDSLSEIEKTVTSQYQGFEDKIIRQVRMVEGKILNNDEVYFAFQAKYKDDLKSITNELDDFKKSIVKLEVARNNPNDPLSLKGSLNDLHSKIEKIEKSFLEIESSNGLLKSPAKTKDIHNVPVVSSSSGKTINVDAKFNQLNAKIIELEKKISIVNIVSVVSIITALIALAISLFL